MPPAVHDDGDILLFALSSWRETTWPQFKTAFDSLRFLECGKVRSPDDSTNAQEQGRTARLLASLGHCDLDYQSKPVHIIVGPPVLATLPVPGLPRAVLCGSRAPGAIGQLRAVCESLGAVPSVKSQSCRVPYAPSWIQVEADSREMMLRVSGALGITLADTPPAWTIAANSGSIREYLEALSWSSEPQLNWEREDFHPESLRFNPSPASGEAFRLARYRDPVRQRWTYRLWQRSRSAEVDPAWGRFAVLEANDRRVLAYEERVGAVSVPLGTPLPVMVARALVMCSGIAPRRDNGTWCEIYDWVPPDLFEHIARKLGQLEPVTAAESSG